MKIQDFDYQLPEELIAQFPVDPRPSSRLLQVNRTEAQILDRQFSQLPQLLNPGDVLVLNNTKVIPARLFGEKSTGGKIEIFIDRILDNNTARALIRSSKSPKSGSLLKVAGLEVKVIERDGDLFYLQFPIQESLHSFLAQQGEIPLPPYIQRHPQDLDQRRYQTVYAEQGGAVAAPTAGLHFDQELLAKLKERGIELVSITLHVGLGTFQPVRVEDIKEHKMHQERFVISQQAAKQILQAKQENRRLIPVGTTSLRCLESIDEFSEQSYQGETDLFIYPGYVFKHCHALITNFHLPRSTLLMLVSAFTGHSLLKNAYAHAIQQRYRFFSYGDAMFIEN